MTSEPLIKSYVWHGNDCFFVSTIERDSSAMVAPPAPRYAETIAWLYDYDDQSRIKQVGMDGSGPAFSQHFAMCRQLYDTGEVRDE
ncbi:MAG TPA: hypothetical protein VMX74_13565 [Pirellulales bacterium]|nr:hypothetical protein [Pirellulales bacterium]